MKWTWREISISELSPNTSLEPRVLREENTKLKSSKKTVFKDW